MHLQMLPVCHPIAAEATGGPGIKAGVGTGGATAVVAAALGVTVMPAAAEEAGAQGSTAMSEGPGKRSSTITSAGRQEAERHTCEASC